MIRLDRRARTLALCLAALAGYVDAVGFVQVGGFFVSFMSGNSTRLAVGIVNHAADWIKAAALILAFFIGVVSGSLVGRRFARRHRAVLVLVTAMLAIAAAGAQLGGMMISALALAFAMGAENATFERDGEVLVGLTYMTGTLVKAGQRIAGAVSGEDPRAWIPHMILWLSLIAGAVAGAAMHAHFGVFALWLAVLIAGICCVAAGGFDH